LSTACNRTGGENYSHDTGLALDRAVVPAGNKARKKPRAEVFDLAAGIAETGNFDNGLRADMEPGACWQRQEIDAFCQDIFSEIAGGKRKAIRNKLFEKLKVDEMDLPKIWLGGIDGDTRAMLNGGSEMRITRNAEAGDEIDRAADWL
jgi:hypothetical protein